MTKTIQATTDFELSILKACLLFTTSREAKLFKSRVQEFISPAMFSTKRLWVICSTILAWYKQFPESPSKEAFNDFLLDWIRFYQPSEEDAFNDTYIPLMDAIWKQEIIWQQMIDKVTIFAEQKIIIDTISKAIDELKCTALDYTKEQSPMKELAHKIAKGLLKVDNVRRDDSQVASIGIEEDLTTQQILSLCDVADVHNADIRLSNINFGVLNPYINGGLFRGELGCVVAKPGAGKCLAPDTPVLTPYGYKAIKNINVGDEVISVDGSRTKVIGKFYHKDIDLYKMKMVYGGEVVCCGDHLWNVKTKKDNAENREEWRTLNTKELINDLYIKKNGRNKRNFNIPTMTNAADLEPTGEELPINPWVFGVWVSQGDIKTMGMEETRVDILQKFRALLPADIALNDAAADFHRVRYRLSKDKKDNPFRLALLDMGFGNTVKPFIPKRYLFASVEDRLALLQGLLDAKGVVNKNGCIEYSSMSYQLIQDVRFLAESLGCFVSKHRIQYLNFKIETRAMFSKPNYIIAIRPYSHLPICTSPRLLANFDYSDLKDKELRLIDSITYIGKGDGICIAVDHPSQLYVVKDLIVTHNTTLLTAMGAEAIRDGKRVLHISLENKAGKILQGYVRNELEDDITSETLEHLDLKKYPIHTNLSIQQFPTGSLTLAMLTDLIEKVKVDKGWIPDLLIVDYAELMCRENKQVPTHEWLPSMFVGLRDIAFAYNLSVLTANQINRVGASKNAAGQEDVAGAFAINNTCDQVYIIQTTDKETMAGQFRLFLAKSRNAADKITILCAVSLQNKTVRTLELIDTAEEEMVNNYRNIRKPKSSDFTAPDIKFSPINISNDISS